jgi:hypothetical protein
MRVHVLLEIEIHVFKDEDELVLRVYHVVQPDDIVVLVAVKGEVGEGISLTASSRSSSRDMAYLELLHEGDLPNGSRRRPFFRVEVDLFERDNVICDS